MSLNTIKAIMILNAKKGVKGKGWTDAARKKAALTRKAKAKVKSKPSLPTITPREAAKAARVVKRRDKMAAASAKGLENPKVKSHVAKINSELSKAKISLIKAQKKGDYKEQEKHRMEVQRLEGAKKAFAPASSGSFPGSGSRSIIGSLGSSSLNR